MDKITDLKQTIIQTLDINKAQEIISIDLKDKSSMADYMIIASGTSSRHIQSLSDLIPGDQIGLLCIHPRKASPAFVFEAGYHPYCFYASELL